MRQQLTPFHVFANMIANIEDPHLSILIGTVLEGVTPNDVHSINSVFRGDVLLPDRSIRRAFIKDLDSKQLGNELLVAALAHRLGIPVPDAVIAIVSPEISSAFSQFAHPSGKGYIAFCSMDAEGSPVAQIVGRDGTDQHVMKYVKRSPVMGQMYGLDTWVANVDRHAGNLIVRGDGSVALIDHGHCFSGPTWTPSGLVASKQYPNRLEQWLTPKLTQGEKDAAMADINALLADMVGIDVQALIDTNHVNEALCSEDCDSVIGFLEARVGQVLPLGAKALATI